MYSSTCKDVRKYGELVQRTYIKEGGGRGAHNHRPVAAKPSLGEAMDHTRPISRGALHQRPSKLSVQVPRAHNITSRGAVEDGFFTSMLKQLAQCTWLVGSIHVVRRGLVEKAKESKEIVLGWLAHTQQHRKRDRRSISLL